MEAGNWYRFHFEAARDTAFQQLFNADNELIEEVGAGYEGHAVTDPGQLTIGTGLPQHLFTGAMDNVKIYNYSTTFPPVATDPEGRMPEQFWLSQNYPNPFNPSTTIRFNLPETDFVTLTVYDLLGREVKKLVNEQLFPGQYTVNWNGENRRGKKVASGVYFYRLKTQHETKVKKMVLLR